MTKKMIIALVLLALAALILLLNNKGPKIDVYLWVTTVATAKALVFFCWLALGVLIGVLLGK